MKKFWFFVLLSAFFVPPSAADIKFKSYDVPCDGMLSIPNPPSTRTLGEAVFITLRDLCPEFQSCITCLDASGKVLEFEATTENPDTPKRPGVAQLLCVIPPGGSIEIECNGANSQAGCRVTVAPARNQ